MQTQFVHSERWERDVSNDVWSYAETVTIDIFNSALKTICDVRKNNRIYLFYLYVMSVIEKINSYSFSSSNYWVLKFKIANPVAFLQ